MLLKKLSDRLKTMVNSIVNLKFIQPYWVEIRTLKPECIYFFGPFKSRTEAKKMQYGYVEDLIEEKAMGISTEIKRCLPTKLTIAKEESLAE